MSYALTRYTADGVTLSFTVGFTYRDADDVIVKVDGVLQTFPTDYALTSGGSQVSFPSAPANGAAIFITRSTSQSVRLTDYTAGAIFKESDLDTDSIQAFNMSQEAIDIAKDSIAKDAFGVFDAQGIRIKNVADPINDQDAATKNHVKLALADFKAKYYGASATAPESPIEGGLWWDSVNNIMKVYNGASWESVNSVVNGTANRSLYTVGVSSGAYTGSTTVFPSAYDVGYVDVFLNGVKLIPSTDFTATDGSTIVLASAAANADRVEVIGYGVFELSPAPVSLNVLDYGAVGDGVVDDTASVQAAINAGNGNPVVFPANKTFSCGQLTVTSNDRLEINGTVKAKNAIGSNPLITGSNLTNVRIYGNGFVDGNKNNVGAVNCTGIKLLDATDCSVKDITIQNCHLENNPGIDGAGLWIEGGADNAAINVTSKDHRGNAIVFGNLTDSYTQDCKAANCTFGSGVAHTRGLRAKSINDFADNNDYSNITVNCEESQIFSPTSRNSGYSGINIGHDSEASDASRTLLVGGVSENNNFEGISVAGSSDVTIIGTYCNNNGANGGANNRYGIRTLSGCERLHIVGAKVTASKNSGIYLQSGSGHRIESTKSYGNDRTGMLLTVTEANVSDCEVFNNNQLGGTNRAGIQIESGNVNITDSHIYDDQGSPTQSYGILASGGVHNAIGCSITGNAVSPTQESGGTVDYYQTRIGTDAMSGTFTLSAGTSTVVNNDNASSPSRIILIPRAAQSVTMNAYPANVVSGTSFTVSHFNASGTEAFNYIIM